MDMRIDELPAALEPLISPAKWPPLEEFLLLSPPAAEGAAQNRVDSS